MTKSKRRAFSTWWIMDACLENNKNEDSVFGPWETLNYFSQIILDRILQIYYVARHQKGENTETWGGKLFLVKKKKKSLNEWKFRSKVRFCSESSTTPIISIAYLIETLVLDVEENLEQRLSRIGCKCSGCAIVIWFSIVQYN